VQLLQRLFDEHSFLLGNDVSLPSEASLVGTPGRSAKRGGPAPPGRHEAETAPSGSSVVVAGAADVPVQRQLSLLSRARWLAVQVVAQDGDHALVRARPHPQRPRARRLYPLHLVAPAQVQDAQARPEALLRVDPAPHYFFDERRGGRAGL